MALVLPNLEIQDQIFSNRFAVKLGSTDDLDTETGDTWTYSSPTLTSDAATATIDGVAVVNGDLILVKNQTTSLQNGIYEVSNVGTLVTLTRTFLDTGDSANSIVVWLQAGTAGKNTSYVCTSAFGSDIVNTNNLTWVQYDVVNTLSIARGGTNATSFTTNKLVYYDGTSLVSTTYDYTAVITGGTGTDNHIVRWNGTGTTTIQDSTTAQIDDLDNITGLANVGMSGDILDANGNELINFTTTASAVNEIAITNAATGTNPIFGATGGDANIGINFLAKGTGSYDFLGTAAQSAMIKWYEDTDNGTNYVSFESPAALAGDLEFIWPTSVGSTGQVLTTAGGANPVQLSWSTVANSRPYSIQPNKVAATSTSATAIAVFPWDFSAFGTPSSVLVTLWVDVAAGKTLTFDVYDTAGAASLIPATSYVGATSGIQTVSFSSFPAGDTYLEFRVQKSVGGGGNPTVSGIIIDVVF